METKPDLPRPQDPLIDEIRKIKESISAEFGHDVLRLCRELRREQEAGGRRLIHRPVSTRPGTTEGA
jgi:hypothetical protein